MKRRLALTFAGSAALVLTAGSAAVAANLGILGAASQEPVGKLDANSVAQLSTPVTSLDPIVVTVDEIVPVPVEVPTTEAPPADDHDDSDEGWSSDGASGSVSRPTPTTAAPTPTTVRSSDSGSSSIDDHSGSDDDHSGSGTDDEHDDD